MRCSGLERSGLPRPGDWLPGGSRLALALLAWPG